jgi:hypothetical protein
MRATIEGFEMHLRLEPQVCSFLFFFSPTTTPGYDGRHELQRSRMGPKQRPRCSGRDPLQSYFNFVKGIVVVDSKDLPLNISPEINYIPSYVFFTFNMICYFVHTVSYLPIK